MIKIGVIIPTRGEAARSVFMRQALLMLSRQTLQPTRVEVIGDPPLSEKCDISYRYKRGYQKLNDGSVDLICFWEEDDYYAPDYLEYVSQQWVKYHKPDLIGHAYTIYYHLRLKRYFTFRHAQNSSAMNTMIRPGLEFTWPADHDPYTDMWLWRSSGIKNKIIFEPNHVVCVSMKHGAGMTGGAFHTDENGGFKPDGRYMKRYINEDNGFLQNTVDPNSYNFYSTLAL